MYISINLAFSSHTTWQLASHKLPCEMLEFQICNLFMHLYVYFSLFDYWFIDPSSFNNISRRVLHVFYFWKVVKFHYISVFACLGFLSPANRGALMTCALVLYVCLGTPAGYISARLYKSEYFWQGFYKDSQLQSALMQLILIKIKRQRLWKIRAQLLWKIKIQRFWKLKWYRILTRKLKKKNESYSILPFQR